jgi:hypothetical protein
LELTAYGLYGTGCAGIVHEELIDRLTAGILCVGAMCLLWATHTRAGVAFLIGVGLLLLAEFRLYPRSEWGLRRLTLRRPTLRWRAFSRSQPPSQPRAPRPALRKPGQALVEFALILPVLLVVLISILEFGRLYMEYFNLHYLTNNTAQAAARLGGDVAELDLVIGSHQLPPLRIENVAVSIDTLSSSGAVQCSGASATCVCEYGDVIRVSTRYPTSISILGFQQEIALQASSTLFCWRGGAP